MFHPRSTKLLADVASLMMGAAAVGAMTAEAGHAMDPIVEPLQKPLTDRTDIPHRVVVAVTDDVVRLFAADRHGTLGPQVCSLGRGTFRARMNHYIGDIDLTIDSTDEGYMVLSSKAGPLHHAAARTAAATVALARPATP